jgi:ADP-ribose pyrophosphatase
MSFDRLDSELVYQGRVFDVRRDQVLLPDGKRAFLDVVAHGGAVTVLPIDAAGMVWFVRQFRYAAGATLLELPAGTLEPGEDPADCARREVREEVGMSAGRLEKIGGFFLAPGYSTEFLHIYLATELTPNPLEADADEFLSVETLPLEQAYALAETGQLQDGKTLATLLLARRRLVGK